MNNRRLWPVTTALVVLVTGSASIEVLARVRDPGLEHIEIASNQVALEEDGPGSIDGDFGPPLGPEHARARELARRGELGDAVERLAELASQHPEHPVFRAEQAHALLRASRPADALPLLQAAARELPDSATVIEDLGLCLDVLGKSAEAVDTLRGGLRVHPSHAGVRISLGEVLRRQGNAAEAVSVLEPAAKRGSNDERAQALASLGRCYIMQGRPDAAHRAFDEAVQRAPASVNTWVRVARGLLQSEDHADQERALEYANRAVRLAPELPLVHSLLGRIHEKLDHAKEAVAAYREAVRLDHDYAYARRRLLRLALDAEDYRLARQHAEALLHGAPEVAEHHFLAGLVEARAGELELARQHYETAISRSQGHYPEALYNLGILERQAKRPASAIAAYERAIEQRPNFRAAYNNLTLVYLEQGMIDKAEASARGALRLDERYPTSWTNLARCLSAQNKPDEAVAAYRRAMSFGAPSRALMVDLAIALRKAGKPEEAIALYRQLLATDARYVTGWYNLGIALEALGKLTEAQQAYQRALEIDPEHIKSLENLAQLEARAGWFEAARAHLTDALDRDPTDQSLRLTLAQLMWSAHDFAGCSHAAQLVLAQTPENSDAKALLGRCARQ